MLSVDQQPGYGPTNEMTRPAAAPRRRWGRIAALLGTGLVLGVVITIAAFAVAARSPVHYTYGIGGQVPEFALTTTGCVQGRVASGRAFPSSATVLCDQPHDAEVFAVPAPFDTSTKLPYPGEDPLSAYAERTCQLYFGSALVGGDDKAALDVVALIPTDQQFSTPSGSGGYFYGRAVICVLQARDGAQLTGARLVS
jgi:hypothetical protein